MLDSVASVAADTASEFLEKYYEKYLDRENLLKPLSAVLSYSPGYCGWDITGQKKLFEYLKPSQIGITINESCLMTPIKSVSGVLVAGDREIHFFQIGFSYCDLCKTQSCQERMSRL
jgi:cobalamin-dependent methionine synthase I